MKRIAVYCGSNSGARPEYASVATEVGAHLAGMGLGIVFGGGNVGLMGTVARAALHAGGEVIGVMPEMFKEHEGDRLELTVMHIVEDMHSRKAMMAALSDGFIALPGGLGTMDEIFEIATWGQLEIHNKPAGFLNTAGYYNGLKSFLDHMVTEGFVQPEHRTMIMIEANITDLVDRFVKYQPPLVSKRIAQ